MVPWETAHVVFQVAAFIAAKTVVAENEDAGVGTDALFQVRAAQNRNDSLEAPAIHIVVQSIDVTSEFQDAHVQRIAHLDRVPEFDALL